jgi:hypothetical protein
MIRESIYVPSNRWILFALLLSHGAVALAAPPPGQCAAEGDLVPICGVHAPEDIEPLPGGKELLLSQLHAELDPSGAMRWMPGSLAVLDLRTRATRVLYQLAPRRTTTESWGDASCPGEIGDALSPHGIHLSKRRDGRMQLLVVNHGGRESVEFFEVTGHDSHVPRGGRGRREASGEGELLTLEWRGCAVAPPFSALNDVVALPQGGFLVTHMTRNDGPDAMMRGIQAGERGENTGHVWRWQPSTGFVVQRGSEGPMPNGIQLDAAGEVAYINMGVSTGGVRKIELDTGEVLGFASLPNPDNSSWTEDGHLLVAGLSRGADIAPCLQATFAVSCGAKFYVAELDPATLATKVLLEHEGPPMGLATVAVEVGKFLYVGSAAGDRILRVPRTRAH